MTYLELVQEVIQQSGAHIDAPSTLVGADGVEALIADYVNQSWHEIQMERLDWFFRSNVMATATIASGEDRLIIRPNGFSNVVDWSTTPPTISAASVDYDFMRWSVFIGSSSTLLNEADLLTYVKYHPEVFPVDPSDKPEGKPTAYTINSQGDIVFDTQLDDSYRIYLTAPTDPQELSADDDVPSMLPAKYHMAIVWKAIYYYGMYRQDPSVIEMGRVRQRPYKKWLESREMPQVHLVQNTLYRGC